MLKTVYKIILLFVSISVIAVSGTPQTFSYPTSRTDSTVDNYHGISIADPYRWLESATTEETISWTEQQNKVTEQYLTVIPMREEIRARLTDLWNYAKYSVPKKHGEHYFFWKNNGLQNQSVLYMVKDLHDEPIEVIDPNTMSDDGTTAISGCFISHDGTLLAYALSHHGSDWKEIKIRTIGTGKEYKEYEEVIKWCKFTSVAWKHDNSGFYYNRFAEDGLQNVVYCHNLGTPQTQDQRVFEYPGDNTVMVFPSVTKDGKFLIIHCMKGSRTNNAVYYKAVDSSDFCIKLFAEDATYDFIGNIDSIFYFLTNKDASRNRIIALDINTKLLKEIIAEDIDTLEGAAIFNNQIVCCYMHDAYHQLKIYDKTGNFSGNISLPTIGAVEAYAGKQKESEVFIKFASFLYPDTIFRYDFATNSLTELWKSNIDIDPSLYETQQVFYQSKDGTKVPMFIIHKKDVTLDGNNPTIVYAYGGFEISKTPYFSAHLLHWLDHGGVMAIANIRGGGEYGKEWHEAATQAKRQNSFDDFIAAAEWLIKNNYTQSSKLASMGGSNGGLLVATCMNQRPELFGAVICQVPVTDMLRYPKFTAGYYWIPEYGDATESLETFNYLYAYSPLHNVKANTPYPAILVTTADTDDRVVPLHAKKFIATLQAKNTGNNPMLLRTEMKAGHGAGKPTSKQIAERTDIYAFLFNIFKMGQE